MTLEEVLYLLGIVAVIAGLRMLPRRRPPIVLHPEWEVRRKAKVDRVERAKLRVVSDRRYVEPDDDGPKAA